MNIKQLQTHNKPVHMTEEEVQQALSAMESDSTLDTQSSYVKTTPAAGRVLSFREKHAEYLKEHPKINPEYYLANLRTMIKIRPSK